MIQSAAYKLNSVCHAGGEGKPLNSCGIDQVLSIEGRDLPPDWVCTKINYASKITQYMQAVNRETLYVVSPYIFSRCRTQEQICPLSLMTDLIRLCTLKTRYPIPEVIQELWTVCLLRTHGGSAAQRRPGNTRSKQERRK